MRFFVGTEANMAEETDSSDKAGGEGGRAEVVVAVVLSVSGLMTAWAGYQGALWEGKQAEFYAHAGELRTIASGARLEVDNWRSNERELFGLWLEASLKGEAKLADFYKSRFPADLRPVFDAWVALDPLTKPGAPPGPQFMPGYRPQGTDKAEHLDSQADAATGQGQAANAVSDRFTQGGLFLATSMFFGGIGQVFKMERVKLGLLAIAVICCAAGVLRILTLPMLRPD